MGRDRKSTRLNSSHVEISYAVFCLKKKTIRAASRRDAPLLVFSATVNPPQYSPPIHPPRCQGHAGADGSHGRASEFRFFFNDPPTPETYTLSLHDALPL